MDNSIALVSDPQPRQPGSKIVAPFGAWESEITKEAVFSTSWILSSPRVDVSFYWVSCIAIAAHQITATNGQGLLH